eukprot:UN00513
MHCTAYQTEFETLTPFFK